MSTEDKLQERIAHLPLEKQELLLDFVEFLLQRNNGKKPLKSPVGLCADLHTDITDEDIAAARREMWGNFPREDLL